MPSCSLGDRQEEGALGGWSREPPGLSSKGNAHPTRAGAAEIPEGPEAQMKHGKRRASTSWRQLPWMNAYWLRPLPRVMTSAGLTPWEVLGERLLGPWWAQPICSKDPSPLHP